MVPWLLMKCSTSTRTLVDSAFAPQNSREIKNATRKIGAYSRIARERGREGAAMTIFGLAFGSWVGVMRGPLIMETSIVCRLLA